MHKKIKPKTRPTGRPPSGSRTVLHEEVSGELQLAELVKRCYVEERSLWESARSGQPVIYRPPAVYDGAPPITIEGERVLKKASRNEWLLLARKLQDLGVEPAEYIQIQFAFIPSYVDRAPEPNQLTAPSNIERWRTNSDRLGGWVRVALVVEKNVAECAYEQARDLTGNSASAWWCVLANPHLELSALFRYCMAKILIGKRFRRLTEQYHDAANAQFVRQRSLYVEHWGSFLPIDLRHGA